MKYLINLFPEHEKSTSEKIVYFGFHYLRYILVITQFIAICVFFFRFRVDQEIVDLKDTLSQKQSIVVSTEQLMGRVDEIDAKSKNIQTILDDQDLFRERYTYVIETLDPSIIVDDISLNVDGVDIKGSSVRVEPIRSYYERLLEEKKFNVIDLSSIERTADSYVFSMRLAEFIP